MTTSTTTYLMNPATGSVDTKENWEAEVSCWDECDAQAGQDLLNFNLVEVRLANGAEVPADFNSCQSDDLDWEEVN